MADLEVHVNWKHIALRLARLAIDNEEDDLKMHSHDALDFGCKFTEAGKLSKVCLCPPTMHRGNLEAKHD